jgi:hypothetical protein
MDREEEMTQLRAKLDEVLAFVVADSDWIGDKWWKRPASRKGTNPLILDAKEKRAAIEPLVQDYRDRHE